jgi:phosphoribosylanthranilate isomerase
LFKTVYVKQNLNEEMWRPETLCRGVVDAFTKDQYGGTGKGHDWTVSRQIKDAVAPVPVILAGGLNPQNVKEAVLAVHPYAVDVASGVELRPAVKDHKKVYAFVENAKEIKLQK